MVALNYQIINEVFMKKIAWMLTISLIVLINVPIVHAESIKLSVDKIENKGKITKVQFRLAQIKDGKPVTLDELKEVHTEKVHLLIIDDWLDDYSHVHPVALEEPGVYQFEWTPKKKGNYRIWADLFPRATNNQEYVIADLTSDKTAAPAIKKSVQMDSKVNDYHFRLSFETPQIRVGKPIMASVLVTNPRGNPVTWLEPVMGAYAHIVGFSQDWKSVVHIHPMGIEPKTATDKGGPMIRFHMQPEKAGFVKLFVQVRINGKEMIAPFAFDVVDRM